MKNNPLFQKIITPISKYDEGSLGGVLSTNTKNLGH